VSSSAGSWVGLGSAGLRVVETGGHVGRYRFSDVETLLRYLSHVPWDLPDDFTVRTHLDVLGRLHRDAEAGAADDDAPPLVGAGHSALTVHSPASRRTGPARWSVSI
jgi:hypothetical protein